MRITIHRLCLLALALLCSWASVRTAHAIDWCDDTSQPCFELCDRAVCAACCAAENAGCMAAVNDAYENCINDCANDPDPTGCRDACSNEKASEQSVCGFVKVCRDDLMWSRSNMARLCPPNSGRKCQ